MNPNLPDNSNVIASYQLEMIRQAALERFDFFASAILGYKVTPFHAKMVEHQLSTPHSMVLAPRGGGKSTICDVAYCLWRMVKDPNIRICIASKTGDQAKGFLGEIKAHIDQNEDFIKVFGNLKGNKWNEDEIVIGTRNKIRKEPTITALGAGAGIPGRHFDLIIGDDLVDTENCATEHQRMKLKTWFYMTLLPTLEPEGELRIIGTRYHAQDLYGHFAKKEKVNVRPGEPVPPPNYVEPKIGPYVHCVSALVVNPETGEEESFWPDKFTLEHLQGMRRSMGIAIFNLQMQNDAEITEGGIIRIEDIEPYTWVNTGDIPDRSEMAIFQGVDPAISKKQTADFFAHATIGIKGKDIFVLEITEHKFSFNEQVAYIMRKWREWSPEKIAIESVAYQQALAQVIAEQPWVPVLQVRPRNDKEQRARVLSAYFERHEVHLRYDMYKLMEVLVGMPSVEHDDLFDALDLAVEGAKETVLSDSIIAVMRTNHLRR